MSRDRNEPRQPPGAGLPWLENAVLNAFFKFGTVVMSDRSAIKVFNQESDRLLQYADDGGESYDVSQELLIPRVIGIEDSSRNWSVLMVLEHLCMTNRDMLMGINSLLNGTAPHFVAETKNYKPSPDVGFDVIERYRQLCSDYVGNIESLIKSRGSLKSSVRFAHPWFGPLDAHQWHCLVAIHQRIHRRQAHKIIAMLGVT